jgi:hypothetical protein
MRAQPLHPRRRPLTGVHGPPRTLLLLLQAQRPAVMVSQTQA